MGAKAPEKLKIRRQSCKCHVCGRKFVNVQALTSHRKYVHKTDTVVTRRGAMKKLPDLKHKKLVKKKVTNPPDSKTTALLPSSKQNSSKVTNEVSNVKKTNFKCPKCLKVFGMYFSAKKHIQKHHCVDQKDRPIPPDSPKIIKPIPVDFTESHNRSSKSWQEIFLPSGTPVCETIDGARNERCMCLGCQKTFNNLPLFEQHVKDFHTTHAECLFFANTDDFTAWKTKLEAITKVEFLTLQPNIPKPKRIYHCSHEPPIITEKTLLCPATLSIKKLNKGYQVIYYKEHFGHSCLDLPPLEYKQYSILPFLQDIEINKIDGDEHVYQQLKSILYNVTVNAAKANIGTGVLYSLLENALAMTVILNSVEPEEQEVSSKSMTDDQISQVLSVVKTYPGKRKAETVKKDVKQTKLEKDNNENVETNSINKPGPTKTVAKKTVESLPLTPIQSSPSFNDTYKDFVDQNFKSVFPEGSSAKKNSIKKKAVVKTKIGQFKIRPSLSPKASVETQTPSPLKVKANRSPRQRKNLSHKTVGQVSSPKTDRKVLSPKRANLNHREYKIKPDFKYEVIEQENDCNILILKI